MMRFLPLAILAAALHAAGPGVVFEGGKGPGKGKHVVLIAADQEYRSEEALPQLARILATRHGFKCTVLFATDPKDGTVDMGKPNIPGLETLARADLLILFLRWVDLPDDQMKPLVDYIESGRPIMGMRTATHCFNLKSSKTYERYTWNSKQWDGGFGRQVLGETWVAHHGRHGVQSTRGVIAKGEENHPVLRGIKDGGIWGSTDVYKVKLPMPGDSRPLVLGQVLTGMQPTDPPVPGPQNDPMMPVAWVKTYKGAAGRTARIFNTTMGSSQDLLNEGVRRMLVNACYWAVGRENKIQAKSNVALVGDYKPSPFKMDGYKKGLKPAEMAGQ
ncbi:MAG TPA: ThuA domain-containing protein [Bryobacteraceae bacterium]|jgi:hypothetical protein|nr:ThuA domain-containing protein [Bryobacteraceae bacterium]